MLPVKIPSTKQSESLGFPKSYYSRAGRASLSKFKILQEKDQILSGDKPTSLFKGKTEPNLPKKKIGSIIFQDLEKFSIVINKQKKLSQPILPSASFRSPARKNIFHDNESPAVGLYNINYAVVEKTPVVHLISKTQRIKDLPIKPDSFLSANLHSFPEKPFKGIPFECQTSRKDITEGLPSPHDERFAVHNLVPLSCSKFTFSGSPNIEKYARRSEFFKNNEFSPDYSPNKEFVLPKITQDIKFKFMTDRKSSLDDFKFPKIYNSSTFKRVKINSIHEIPDKHLPKKKKIKLRAFSPSNFEELNEGHSS